MSSTFHPAMQIHIDWNKASNTGIPWMTRCLSSLWQYFKPMLHFDNNKILLPFLLTTRSCPYPQRFLSGFILNSSYHEDNTLVSYSKYKITYWLCISNHRICSISFSRITALDFPVENNKLFLWCVTLSLRFSPFISPFSFWRMHSYSLWGRCGVSTGNKVWAHPEVQPGEGCWDPKQNEAANLWRGGVAGCVTSLWRDGLLWGFRNQVGWDVYTWGKLLWDIKTWMGWRWCLS